MASFMYLAFGVGCWLSSRGRVGVGALLSLAFHPLLIRWLGFHMIEEIFQEGKNRSPNLLRNSSVFWSDCVPAGIHVEVSTPSVTVFGDETFMEVIKVRS